jgi:hypothetical protein
MCIDVFCIPWVHTPHVVDCQGSKVPAGEMAECRGRGMMLPL